MFNYFLKRATIAISQRKSWFLIPIALTVVSIAWMYLSSPTKYVISSRYTPSIQSSPVDKEQTGAISEAQLWSLALRELGVGSQFIANRIQESSINLSTLMPSLIKEWAKTKASSNGNIEPQRNRAFKREIIRHIISYVTMDKVVENGNEFAAIEFVYRGEKKSLGTKLIGFYSQELLDPWRKDIQKKKGRTESKVRYLAERMEGDETAAAQQKFEDYKVQVRNYTAMLNLLKGSPSAVVVEELEKELSDAIVAQSFYLLILLSLFTLGVIIIVEFTGKTFTTEYQVSQYLGIKLIGTIPEVKAIKNFKSHS